MSGISAKTRSEALAARETEFAREMQGLEQGATGTTLREYWQRETGGAGAGTNQGAFLSALRSAQQSDSPAAMQKAFTTRVAGGFAQQGGGGTPASMEEFFAGRFGGGYVPEGGAAAGGPGGSRRSAAAMNPMAAALAPVAGIGPQRQWWAL